MKCFRRGTCLSGRVPKGQVIPVTGRGYHRVDRVIEAPTFFKTVASQMAVRLSDLRAGLQPFTPRKIPGTHFC
jgi:hypothetical protein